MSFFELPKFGFGFMRLPMLDANTVDIEQTKKMVDVFIENGFNYFDSAWGYLGGKSEMAMKETIIDRYPREKVRIATKLPAWHGTSAKTKESSEQMLYTSLERTGAGYFDYYLMHNLGREKTAYYDNFGLWDFAQKRKDEGLIKHLGFSFHDNHEALDKLLCEHPEAEFVQLQINYNDWNDPTVESKLCYEVARAHNKPVVIMEPIKGGTLANPPQDVVDIFKAAEPDMSPASWALRFAASLEGVFMVLSGMSTLAQVEENVKFMKGFTSLNADQMAVVEKAREAIEKYPIVPCTSCGYCMKECPKNVAIFGTFEAYNIVKVLNNVEFAKGKYAWNTGGQGLAKASECIKCGKCELACPQHIKIRDELAAAAAVLG